MAITEHTVQRHGRVGLGLWVGFGRERPFAEQRALLRHAFERDVTSFDLAPGYGPPHGAAEETMGKMLAGDFRRHRGSILVATKFSLGDDPDASLRRLGADYVDVLYVSGPLSPGRIAEAAGTLDAFAKAGKALRVGVASDADGGIALLMARLRQLGTPLSVRQTHYSLVDRRIEESELDLLADYDVACVVRSPLADGLLTDRGRRSDPLLERLGRVADERGQTLEQMAIAWTLRDPRVACALIGARTIAELDRRIDARDCVDFSAAELSSLSI